GRRVEEWRTASGSGPSAADRGDCLAATADLARPTDRVSSALAVSPRMAGSARRVSCQGRPIAAAAPRNGPGFEQESSGRGLVRSDTRDGYAVRRLRTLAFS